MSWKLLMSNPQAILLGEIADRAFKRRDIARTYRLAMIAERDGGDRVDWGAVNRAILARWSQYGLEWIKKQAWSGKCFEEANPPTPARDPSLRGVRRLDSAGRDVTEEAGLWDEGDTFTGEDGDA